MKFDAIKDVLEGMRPTEIITVSEWAEKYRYLSSEASFLGGSLYTCDVTPYARKIMDSLSSYSSYQEVIFCKSSQTGGTEIGNNWLGYIMHISPAPTLMLMPTDGTVERNSKIRIDPMIDHCAELKKRISPKRSRDGENTINQKKFSGGVLYMGGANSAAVLKSIPVRFVMLDEVDEYPSDLGGQGGADSLAKVRTRMWPNRKIYYVSTPTIDGLSLIQSKFLETDQNYFEVPCPHCGGFQKLIWSQLKWERGDESNCYYECIHCEKPISESFKTEMLEQGVWTPAEPGLISSKKIGFHINSLYAPTAFFTWADCIEEFYKGEKDPNDMKVFVNTILGETYAESGESPKWESLYNKSRMENNKANEVPENVCFITAGVDIQKDRIELELVGWCADKQSYSLDFRVLLGNTTLPDVWNQLSEVVNETWIRKDGVEMTLKLMAIDTGYNTNEVHGFCRKYSSSRVIPIKGQDSLGLPAAPPRQIDYNKNGKKIGRLKQWNIGVSLLKGEFYSWLNLEPNQDGTYPNCYCHFLQYDQRYFEGLTAEQYIPKIHKWKKVYERNEPLDCRIYARAAANIVGLDRLKTAQLMAMGGVVAQTLQRKEKKEKKKRKSSFWE